MGKFDFNISPEFIKRLGRLADVDRIAPKMIDEATPILEANMKSEAASHRLTGAMINSIKKNKAGAAKGGGYWAAVRPRGKDANGVRNMEKMACFEYGVKKKKGNGWRIAPTPMITKAIKDSAGAVYKKMQETFDREIKT